MQDLNSEITNRLITNGSTNPEHVIWAMGSDLDRYFNAWYSTIIDPDLNPESGFDLDDLNDIINTLKVIREHLNM